MKIKSFTVFSVKLSSYFCSNLGNGWKQNFLALLNHSRIKKQYKCMYKYIYMCMYIYTHTCLHQKLTRHCKSTILHYKKRKYAQHRVKICYLFILLINFRTNSATNIKKIHLKTVTWNIINQLKHTRTHLHICAAPNGANKSTQNYKKVIRDKEMTCLDVAFFFFLNMSLMRLYMHI